MHDYTLDITASGCPDNSSNYIYDKAVSGDGKVSVFEKYILLVHTIYFS